MSRTLSNNTSETTLALLNHCRNLDLSVVLGYTTETTKVDNSPDSHADSIANSSIAIRLKDSDFKVVTSVAEHGGNRKWTSGTIPGAWKADGTTGRQYLYELPGGVVVMVTGFPGNNYRSDKEGSIISTEMFTDISGNFATVQGIEYIAINASPTGINTLSSKYMLIDLPEYALGEKLESSTSLSTYASNICGSGNEQLIGTCCLYYKTNGYDSVAGVTHVAGGFHSCDCLRCYRCIEVAKSLDMKYVFTGGTGSTGTDCGCLADGQETYPTDCGPCACNIDWDSASTYSDILSNRNHPETSSTNRNAAIVKKQKEDLTGCIASMTINLKGLTDEQLTLASSFETNAANNTLYVPLVGLCEEEALWEVSTVRDGVTYKYRADGIRKSTVRGKNYTSVSLDETKWALMFPGIPPEAVEINAMPINGFASNLTSILPLSFVIHKVINKSEISSVSDATVFNFYTISSLKDSKGASIYSGHAPEQSNVKSLGSKFRLGAVGSLPDASRFPKKNQVFKNEIDISTSKFTSTTLKELTPSDSYAVGGAFTTAVFADMITPFPNTKVGQTVISEAGDYWTIDAIASKPKGSTNEDYDATKQKIIHRGSLGNFTLSGGNAVETLAIEVKMGALNQTVS